MQKNSADKTIAHGQTYLRSTYGEVKEDITLQKKCQLLLAP